MMRILVCINAVEAGPQALATLPNGKSAFGMVCDFASSVPGFSSAIVLARDGADLPSPYPLRRRSSWGMADVLETLAEASEGFDALVYCFGDEPFLSVDLCSRMLARHAKYRAEYSYADGYPRGLATEILNPAILRNLVELSRKNPLPVTREGIFETIQKDINAFDIETDISPADLRAHRLLLACDCRRDAELVRRFMGRGLVDDKDALDLIPAMLEEMRTFPAFVNVQITASCPQSCSTCPYPLANPRSREDASLMPRERFADVARQVAELSGDAVIDISLWGEPSAHPDIEGLVDDCLAFPGLSMIIETSGIGWRRGIAESLALRHRDRLHWVVSLDAWTEALYTRMRGEGYAEAVGFATSLIGLFPETAYVQAVRVLENEDEMEAFYRGWRSSTKNVIIQKYDSFCGYLPERKVVDLSPIARRPCWHLARDMCVLVDGSVPLCKEAVDGEPCLGNAFVEGGLAAAWEAGKVPYAVQANGEYRGRCGVCDEYYTYNY